LRVLDQVSIRFEKLEWLCFSENLGQHYALSSATMRERIHPANERFITPTHDIERPTLPDVGNLCSKVADRPLHTEGRGTNPGDKKDAEAR